MTSLPIMRYANMQPSHDGSYRAVILAPPDLAPGAATTLADCINDQPGLTARAGFIGADNQHVLRISGLTNPDALHTLLHQTYPEWHKTNRAGQTIAPIEQPLEIVDEETLLSHPYRGDAERFFKNDASKIVSSCYSAGDIAMFISGWNDKKDGYKMYSSAAYQTASTLLLLLSDQADDARSAQDIVQQVHDTLDTPESLRTSGKDDGVIRQAMNFVKHHPWETAAAISATGAVSYIASAMQKLDNATSSDYINLSAGIGTLAAMMLVSFAPEEKTTLNDEHYFQRHKGSMLETAEQLARHPQCSDILSRLQCAKDWIAQHPLQVASAVQTISNVNYGVSAVMAEPKDPTMIAASAAYVTGALSQAYADKHRHASFDDIVTEMSEHIRRDAASNRIANIEARIDALTELVTQEHDVLYSPTAISHAVHARYHADVDPSPYGYLATQEWDAIKDSPFVDHATLQTSFAERLSRENNANAMLDVQR